MTPDRLLEIVDHASLRADASTVDLPAREFSELVRALRHAWHERELEEGRANALARAIADARLAALEARESS